MSNKALEGRRFEPGELIEWNSPAGINLYDEYAERIQILDYPDYATRDGDVWYAGTGIPGATPNTSWVGPCQEMEDAMLAYEEEVESFAEWAKDIYDVVITYDGAGDMR